MMMTVKDQKPGLLPLMQDLASDRSGLALTEFAFSLPIMLSLMVGGAELSNYAVVQSTISQLAVQVADNATRIGTKDPSQIYYVAESQINDILDGAALHAGNLDIYGTHKEGNTTVGNGMIVISNVSEMLEKTNDGKSQYEITWQRCRGAADYEPQYGKFGETSGTEMLEGMGPAGQKATPPDRNTDMLFVEIHYRYQPIFFTPNAIRSYSDIRMSASMLVRDNRSSDLPSANATAYACA
ncbi:TadE/TadG family type IV pilus assembly protein [Sphingorhabdus sp.]|jgi:Flp pilus assembly protein TadG|uniref:TadE/TadG family type IV pilus assembly protein n=1 Tax=Sphingorhabdus sp. TaxID=1902408 RepID=UPI0037CAC85E